MVEKELKKLKQKISSVTEKLTHAAENNDKMVKEGGFDNNHDRASTKGVPMGMPEIPPGNPTPPAPAPAPGVSGAASGAGLDSGLVQAQLTPQGQSQPVDIEMGPASPPTPTAAGGPATRQSFDGMPTGAPDSNGNGNSFESSSIKANGNGFENGSIKANNPSSKGHGRGASSSAKAAPANAEMQLLTQGKQPVAAFVTFQYKESRARCMRDYHLWSSFPRVLVAWCLYPKPMLFRGKRLTVTAAPEPDEVVWENLEITNVSRFFR